MDSKTVRVQIKDADKGEVTAVFATFNVKDADGDVTLPGAFKDGTTVVISPFGHTVWDGGLPVGKGVITSSGNEAVFKGQFFMDTEQGRETFSVVKETAELLEWSYGFVPVKFSFGEFEGERVRFLEEQKVLEVSPVLLGAGVGTRTLATKESRTSVDVESGQKFSDEATAVLASVKALTDRAAEILVKRQEKGKGLGDESTELLEQIEGQMKRLRDLFDVPDVVSVEELGEEDSAALYLIRIHQGV